MDRVIDPRPVLPAGRQIFSNKKLKAMIVPLLIEQLLQLVVGIADTMMVSYAGEATVSGVSLDTMIYTIFIYLFTAVATGAAVIVSQYIGRNDKASANLAASQGFHIAGVTSLVCLALTLVFGNAVLAALYAHVDGAVMSACRIYLRIVALSFPANAIYNAGAALYRSMGRTRTTMIVSGCMNLLNVIGNAIGVFVLKAGAAGVAWPTTISWYFAAVVMTALCLNEKNQVFVRFGDMLRLRRDMAGRILRIAVPNAAEQVLFQLAKVVLGSLIATFGTSQIAANGIGQTLWSLAACMCTSMSPVFITVVGQCMGAGDTEAAAWYMRKLTRLSLMLSTLWNAMVLLLVPLILPLYAVTPETRHYIWVIVIIHNIFAALVQPFAMPLSSGLRAAGDVQFSLWSSLLCTVVFRTALSFALGLGLGMGIVGIAWAMVLDWCLKAVLDVLRFRGNRWKDKKVI
ncbi:MAG: MATE family efflux transporter [Clostridiales bacterium]|nr:MATE family efflux transporter [Clostridiales bacterium]